MNKTYHIAIIEGFISSLPAIPTNVREAIDFFKIEPAPVVVVKKKRRMSKETRALLTENLKKARRVRAANIRNQAIAAAKKLKAVK